MKKGGRHKTKIGGTHESKIAKQRLKGLLKKNRKGTKQNGTIKGHFGGKSSNSQY